MEEQELKRIWKGSSRKEEIVIDTGKLISQFKGNMEHRERIVRRRDLKETFFSVLGIFGFTVLTVRMWFSLPALGMLIIAITYSFYIYKLWSNRKSKYTQNLFIPLKEQLEGQKQFMLDQVKLLDTILYWAIIPFSIGYMTVIWTVWDLDTVNFSSFLSSLYPVLLKSKIIYTVVMLFAFVYVVWTNKKAVRVNWNPLIQQIEVILESLKEEKNT